MESTARVTGTSPSILEVVRAHPHARSLGALCYDVLRRQARGRTLFSGRKYMRARAQDHGVQRKHGKTGRGDVLTILERGPQSDGDWSLVAAFAVRGLGDALALVAEDPEACAREADEFVVLADWLSLATPYDPYAFVVGLLDEGAEIALWGALERGLLVAGEDARPASMVRLQALQASEDGEARLSRLAEGADDPVVAASAGALIGRQSTRIPARVGIEGVPVSSRNGILLRVLFWLTGIALLRWLYQTACWSIGLRRVASVWVDAGAVRTERTTALFGRRVHTIDESLPVAEVTAVVRELRRAPWVGVVGGLCLASGIFGAGAAIFTAMLMDSAAWLAVALAALGIGAGLDLLLDFWWASRGARVWLELTARGRPPLRLSGVHPEEAERLAAAIRAQG